MQVLQAPITLTASPTRVATAAVVTMVSWLVPPAATVGVALLALIAAVAYAMADLAARDVGVREDERIDLGDGEYGRVRAVRWCYTVIDAEDGRTVLVPNHRLRVIA